MPEPAVRNPFTDKEIKKFLRYLAEYSPYDEKRGGNLVYQQLERFSKEKEGYRWARTHPWQGWKNKYRDNEHEYNRAIKALVKKLEEEGKLKPEGVVKKETRAGGKPSNKPLVNPKALKASDPGPSKQKLLVLESNGIKKRKVGVEDGGSDFDPVKVNNGPDVKRQKTGAGEVNVASNGKTPNDNLDAGVGSNADAGKGEDFTEMEPQRRPKDNSPLAYDFNDPQLKGHLLDLGFPTASELLRFLEEADKSKRATVASLEAAAGPSVPIFEQRMKPRAASPRSGDDHEESKLYPTITDQDRIDIQVPKSTFANENAATDGDLIEIMPQSIEPTPIIRPPEPSPAIPPMSSLKEPEPSDDEESGSDEEDEQKDELVSESILEVKRMGVLVERPVPKTFSKVNKGKGRAGDENEDEDKDNFFGSPPPDSGALNGDTSIQTSNPPTRSSAVTNGTARATIRRSLPKHQEGAFHRVLGSSCARKTVSKAQSSSDSSATENGSYSESEESEEEPRSDVADFGLLNNFKTEAMVNEKVLKKEQEKALLAKSPLRQPRLQHVDSGPSWPPQRKPSANPIPSTKGNVPPAPSLVANSDMTFHASQVPTSTPKVVQSIAIAKIKDSPKAGPSKPPAPSENVDINSKCDTKPTPAPPKQFLAPKVPFSALPTKATAPPATASTASVVSMDIDHNHNAVATALDTTLSTACDSTPNNNPFITDDLAKRLYKESKGKEKEVAFQPHVPSASGTDRQHSSSVISRTFSGPPLDLRKQVLANAKNGQARSGEAENRPNLRRVASVPNGFVQPVASSAATLPVTHNAFTTGVAFVPSPSSSPLGLLSPADLSQDVLSSTVLSRISTDDTYHFLRAGVLTIFRTMAAKHDQTEKRVREVYEQCGDLKETDHLLAKLSNMMQEEIARVGERRRSTSEQTTLTASGSDSGSSRSLTEPLETEENRFAISTRTQSKELDLVDISRRSSLTTSDRKRPRNSLNFTPADQDPQYERIVANAYAPLSSRSQRYVRHARHSSLTSPNKSGDRSRRESGLHTVINLDDDSSMEIDATATTQLNRTGNETMRDMESLDSAKEEDEVLISLTPVPQKVSKETTEDQAPKSMAPTLLRPMNGLEVPKNLSVDRNTASPTPNRTTKQGQSTKPPSKLEQINQRAANALPTQMQAKMKSKMEKQEPSQPKPTFKKRSLPPAFTPDEDEFLGKNELGPEFDKIVKRHGLIAVKLRQTELNEADMFD